MKIRYVQNLDGINPQEFAGDIFILPNGEMYKAEPGDQLGGFWSKFLGVVSPIASLIPGVGQAVSMAAGALEAKEANRNAESNKTISQYVANIDSVFEALNKGQIGSSEALAQVKSSYETWADYKMNSADEKEKGYLYKAELEILLPKWKAIEAKAAEVAKTENLKITSSGSNSNGKFGLSTTELLIAGAAIYFIFSRSQ